MSEEVVFRTLFLGYYLLTAVISLIFRTKVSSTGEEARTREEAKEPTGWRLIRRVSGLLMTAAAILYIVHPPFVGALSAPIPVWLRWCGVGLAAVSIPLLVWILRALGKQWSRKLELRKDHELVTSGPYAWVRHPMYVLILLSMSSLALISANWPLISLALICIISIYSRIGQEEEMMIQKFGNEYRLYQTTTGRLFPRLF
jgi:protein-S-isoprenylcysteine O-methyltransferase Ste14